MPPQEFQAVTEQFLNDAKAAGMKKLVIDVSGNGGKSSMSLYCMELLLTTCRGMYDFKLSLREFIVLTPPLDILQGYDSFRQLFPHIVQEGYTSSLHVLGVWN